MHSILLVFASLVFWIPLIYLSYCQTPLIVDCASPLFGKYVTVQKYDYLNGITLSEKYMDLKEVDVVVYCGQFKRDNDNICMPLDDPVDYCDLASVAAEKSLFKLLELICVTWMIMNVTMNFLRWIPIQNRRQGKLDSKSQFCAYCSLCWKVSSIIACIGIVTGRRPFN